MSVVSYSELARELGIAPRLISDAVYRGILNPSQWPKVAGRHVIPRDQVPQVVEILRERGVVPTSEVVAQLARGPGASNVAETVAEI